MRTLFLLLAASASYTAAIGADVVVYGGTAAGVMAAVQAARMGRSVVLVAPEKHLGGIVVEGLGGADVNNHWFRNDTAIGGLAREFYERVGRKYGKKEPVYCYESHVAEEVVEEMLAASRATVRRRQRLREPLRSAVVKDGARLRSITMESGESFEGSVFIDATIEGDLLTAAGVSTVTGREPNALYGETKNGIRAETHHAQFAVRVDPYRKPGDPRSGLIPTIQDESLGAPGDGDRNVQAYCFRMCLTRNPANRIPIAKPEHFDRAQYEIYLRYVRAGGQLWTPKATLPGGKTDLGSWHDLSANLYGMNRDWPDGDYRTRERILREHRDFTQGLLWMMAHDPEIPESTRAAWREWGLCRDEFTDNGGWPRQLYVRDARRMVSDYVITEHHTRRVNGVPVADPVAVAMWPTDTHSVRRIVRDGAAYNEGFVFDDDTWGPFGISYRALVPKRGEALNLITPSCPSSSHVAYGAIRLEQTFMALGQAAATAAEIAVSSGVAVQDIPYEALRQRLTRDGAVLVLSPVPSKPLPSRNRTGVPMALRAASGNQDAAIRVHLRCSEKSRQTRSWGGRPRPRATPWSPLSELRHLHALRAAGPRPCSVVPKNPYPHQHQWESVSICVPKPFRSPAHLHALRAAGPPAILGSSAAISSREPRAITSQ